MDRSLSPAHLDVVAVEGDVDRAEPDLAAGELGDQVPQSLRERDASRVDADERDSVEVGVALDDLVGDPRQAALDRLAVEENLVGGNAGLAQRFASVSVRAQACVYIGLLSGLSGPS